MPRYEDQSLNEGPPDPRQSAQAKKPPPLGGGATAKADQSGASGSGDSGSSQEPPPYVPVLDRYRVRLIWLFQCGVLLAIYTVCAAFDVSLLMWASGVGIYAFSCICLGRRMWRARTTQNPLPSKDPLMLLLYAGIGLTLLATLASIWIFWIRIESGALRWSALAFIGLFALLTLLLSIHRLLHQSMPWFQFVVGVTAIPV